jgi:hypothetical protein
LSQTLTVRQKKLVNNWLTGFVSRFGATEAYGIDIETCDDFDGETYQTIYELKPFETFNQVVNHYIETQVEGMQND